MVDINRWIGLDPWINYEKIINKLKKFEYISFDLFDTLVKRVVDKPDGVFAVLADEYRDVLPNFIMIRKQAERKARDRSPYEEITIDEIYQEINCGVDCRGLAKRETEVEYDCCVQNQRVKRIYDWCIENKKKVVITSDMYLDRKSIERILNKCGYEKYYHIFLSSEEKIRKSDGKLFLLILDKLSIKPGQLIHIGDSVRSDYINPRKIGIHAIAIRRNNESCAFIDEKRVGKEYYHRIAILEDKKWDEFTKYGFEVIGPVIVDFCRWLNRDIEKNGIDQVFFLARDGYLVRKVYAKLYSEKKTKYLYVSRRALRLPLLYIDRNVDTVISLFPADTYICLYDFCSGIGLRLTDEVKDYWIKSGLNFDEYILPYAIKKDVRFMTFLEAIDDELKSLSKKAYHDLYHYLQQEGFKGKVAVVDIGWAGTIQKCLVELMSSYKIDAEIHGYYFGLSNNHHKKIRCKSFVPEDLQIQDFAAPLLEYPFLAPEGSLLRYEKKENHIKPILMEYEYNSRQSDRVYIKRMQEGSLYYAEQFGGKLAKTIQEETWMKSINGLIGLLRNPKDIMLNSFGKLYYSDGKMRQIANPKSAAYYLSHIREFKYDLSNCGWKMGFLKKCFKIKFPYYYVLKMIKNHMRIGW